MRRDQLLIGFLGLLFGGGLIATLYELYNSTCTPSVLSDPQSTCHWYFERYESSPFEKKWLAHADEWGHSPCDQLQQMTKETQKWVDAATASLRGPLQSNTSSGVLSSFWYRSCDGSQKRRVLIEPIGGVNRHPHVCTDSSQYLLSKDWLVVDWNISAPKSFLFDIGASLWEEGRGGNSQKWLWDTYTLRGVNFSAVYAWEAETMDTAEVWKRIPAEVRPVYHWMNIPARIGRGNMDNPLEVIRAVAKPEDFVVLKLDIDSPRMELPLVEQLSSDPELLSLVDEFFFEHHVNMEPLASCCWITTSMKETAASSYQLFHKLREKGVRAHSWV